MAIPAGLSRKEMLTKRMELVKSVRDMIDRAEKAATRPIPAEFGSIHRLRRPGPKLGGPVPDF